MIYIALFIFVPKEKPYPEVSNDNQSPVIAKCWFIIIPSQVMDLPIMSESKHRNGAFFPLQLLKIMLAQMMAKRNI